mmetsp:Transcript_5078/g.14985  ORF Transcript_5078/g.14985 Transcript_5078/m.14985 type:complete len:207 (+) Transcript_5078:1500-2120(+)
MLCCCRDLRRLPPTWAHPPPQRPPAGKPCGRQPPAHRPRRPGHLRRPWPPGAAAARPDEARRPARTSATAARAAASCSTTMAWPRRQTWGTSRPIEATGLAQPPSEEAVAHQAAPTPTPPLLRQDSQTPLQTEKTPPPSPSIAAKVAAPPAARQRRRCRRRPGRRRAQRRWRRGRRPGGAQRCPRPSPHSFCCPPRPPPWSGGPPR